MDSDNYPRFLPADEPGLSPREGQMYYDTIAKQVYVHTNGAWVIKEGNTVTPSPEEH
jgi:hypothetical protein